MNQKKATKIQKHSTGILLAPEDEYSVNEKDILTLCILEKRVKEQMKIVNRFNIFLSKRQN